MPYDTGAASAERGKTGAERRGPLRPSRLAAAGSRLSGGTLARLVQISDRALLAGLLFVKSYGGAIGGSTALLAAASGLVAATLISFEAYQLSVRERLYHHLCKVIGAVGGPCLMMLALASSTAPGARAAHILHIVDWCLTAVALLSVSHFGWFSYIRGLRRRGLLTPNLMIVCATPAAQRLAAVAPSHRG